MKGYKAHENSENHCYALSKIVDFMYTRSVLGPLFLLYGQFLECLALHFLVFSSFLFKELPDGGHVK